MTGVGLGYASMFSRSNATNPAPTKSNKASKTTGRRLRQNAIRDLNTLGRLEGMGYPLDLVRRRRFEHVAEEYGAVRYGHFSRMQAVQDLDLAIGSHAGLDDALREVAAIGRRPRGERAVALPYHPVRGQRR